MGSAALAAAVSCPGKAAWNSQEETDAPNTLFMKEVGLSFFFSLFFSRFLLFKVFQI